MSKTSTFTSSPLTFGDLLLALNEFTPEQLRMSATIYSPEQEEYFPIMGLADNSQDVLDEGHPYFVI